MDQEGVETWEVPGDWALAAPAVPSIRRSPWSLAWEEEAAMVQKTTEATRGQRRKGGFSPRKQERKEAMQRGVGWEEGVGRVGSSGAELLPLGKVAFT